MVGAMGNRQWAMGSGLEVGVARDGIRSYRDLAAWQHARELGHLVYQLTADFPDTEKFGLVTQARRSAVSVASNIAEGYGRGSPRDYARFLRTARGSLFEVETQTLFANDFGYITDSEWEAIETAVNAVARPLSGLIRRIEQDATGR